MVEGSPTSFIRLARGRVVFEQRVCRSKRAGIADFRDGQDYTPVS